jgi:hypothetical protein
MNAASSRAPGLRLIVLPSGLPRIAMGDAASPEDLLACDGSEAIAAAFEEGAGSGVLRLGAVEVGTRLPPAFAYFRELGHELVARVCAHPELEVLRERIRPEPPRERLEQMASAAPPVSGAEYITAETLAAVWEQAGAALGRELASWRGPIAEWLRAKNAAWATVGRVCFHLAENKRDPDAPFAFLATYTTRLSSKGTPQHRPLGHARGVPRHR